MNTSQTLKEIDIRISRLESIKSDADLKDKVEQATKKAIQQFFGEETSSCTAQAFAQQNLLQQKKGSFAQ